MKERSEEGALKQVQVPGGTALALFHNQDESITVNFTDTETELTSVRFESQGWPVLLIAMAKFRHPSAVRLLDINLREDGSIIIGDRGQTRISGTTRDGEKRVIYALRAASPGEHEYSLTAANTSDSTICSADDIKILILPQPNLVV